MQQRVGLARAFATDADILLMDEPFSALDPLIRAKLQDELLELQARLHKTILFVSHDLDEALKLGDRISIMEGGRIIQTGTAEDIMLRPADAYVTEFVAHMNPLTALTGGMVMRRLEDLPVREGAAVLDAGGRYRLSMDGSARPVSLKVDGVTRDPVTADEGLSPAVPNRPAPRERPSGADNAGRRRGGASAARRISCRRWPLAAPARAP